MTLVKGFDTPASVWDQDTTSQVDVTSTSYTAGNPEVGVAFMAPTSGRVAVVVGGGGRDNEGGGAEIDISYELYGPGILAVTPNLIHDGEDTAYTTPGEATDYMYGSRLTVQTGLTPMRQHYARVVHRDPSASGTADVSVRDIIVVPLP